MADCLIGVGANLGDCEAALEQAMDLLRQTPQTAVVRRSAWLRTSPVGGPAGQPPYLNGAVRIETELAPLALLRRLLEIERQLGRGRSIRWGARTLDLDLLLYDQQVLTVREQGKTVLELPHPRMSWRRFVLAPAAEAAPDMVHPTTGWTIARLWRHLNEAPPYAAVTGGAAAVRWTWVGRLAARTQSNALFASMMEKAAAEMMDLAPAVQRAINSVARKRVEAAQGAWVIADTWLSDLEAPIGEEESSLLAARFPDWSSPAEDKAEPPKLLIALAPADPGAQDWIGEVRRRRVGPLLIAAENNLERALDEAAAALAAMR